MALIEGDLNAAAVAHHEAWLVGGQPSARRLVVSKKRYEEADFQAWELNGVRIEDCHFREADFRYTMLQESELVRSEFRQTFFYSCRMQRASWVDLYMEDCNLTLARLNSLTAHGCTVVDSEAFRSQWLDAKISKMDFVRCSLHDSTWTNAVVSHSDFRGCHLGATKGFGELATTSGATFIDCDLRNTTWRGRDLSGATFIRCKFKQSCAEIHSAVGMPCAVSGLVVKDCDVSMGELLGDLLREDNTPLPE